MSSYPACYGNLHNTDTSLFLAHRSKSREQNHSRFDSMNSVSISSDKLVTRNNLLQDRHTALVK